MSIELKQTQFLTHGCRDLSAVGFVQACEIFFLESEIDEEKLTSAEVEMVEHEREHTKFDIRCPDSPSGEGESYAFDASPMSFVTIRPYSSNSTCTFDSEPHHWGESPRQGGASVEGFHSNSPRPGEFNRSLHRTFVHA